MNFGVDVSINYLYTQTAYTSYTESIVTCVQFIFALKKNSLYIGKLASFFFARSFYLK